jgi:hypothetical protein
MTSIFSCREGIGERKQGGEEGWKGYWNRWREIRERFVLKGENIKFQFSIIIELSLNMIVGAVMMRS